VEQGCPGKLCAYLRPVYSHAYGIDPFRSLFSHHANDGCIFGTSPRLYLVTSHVSDDTYLPAQQKVPTCWVNTWQVCQEIQTIYSLMREPRRKLRARMILSSYTPCTPTFRGRSAIMPFASVTTHAVPPKSQPPSASMTVFMDKTKGRDDNVAEQARLEYQHDTILHSMGGRALYAPADLSKPGLRILDSACANGRFLPSAPKLDLPRFLNS
jgi:hypothetical protein